MPLRIRPDKRPRLTPEERALSYQLRAAKRTRKAPKAHPLVRRLITLMNQQEMSRVELCNAAGISVNTFTSWRTVTSPSLTGLEACFIVLGRRLIDAPIVGNGDNPIDGP